ncbi:hypothetical protein BATDEDRAFT_23038 [Batrachochytrium dendrobatidis JAM81]|uniref:Uncharacterized protein n=2 Tax=Batrachochytrium dendrobatidis TaxID=109871 RepID=F4NWJ4_BATDJ|nr:uncharacterized protein BATDEDRAFT_23038 [Batrachochytrium dendrobatidis JAM81]EGF82840.1 hypothetical protein BATDEDRAFT_23038 [Batrachochytrium dendrobatidis JAM81]OAJ39528.1 hypothetical protein BDEG_23367 [Batrachochytrium dendrobatidis JEL423]|eukprot:XP_006676690.1 hypothetical protein BATDEDRAFT_23038 [Batrachochytrium dendrobatidis JAM81]
MPNEPNSPIEGQALTRRACRVKSSTHEQENGPKQHTFQSPVAEHCECKLSSDARSRDYNADEVDPTCTNNLSLEDSTVDLVWHYLPKIQKISSRSNLRSMFAIPLISKSSVKCDLPVSYNESSSLSNSSLPLFDLNSIARHTSGSHRTRHSRITLGGQMSGLQWLRHTNTASSPSDTDSCDSDSRNLVIGWNTDMGESKAFQFACKRAAEHKGILLQHTQDTYGTTRLDGPLCKRVRFNDSMTLKHEYTPEVDQDDFRSSIEGSCDNDSDQQVNEPTYP